MAECECFELTLLICEWVCRQERILTSPPPQHMGSRFTPTPFKDTSKPIWPSDCFLPCCSGRQGGCLSCTHVHVNISLMPWKRLFYSLTNIHLSSLRTVVMRISLLVQELFASPSRAKFEPLNTFFNNGDTLEFRRV